MTAGQSQRIRILAVDDHLVLREGLTVIIGAEPDMEMVAEAESGAQAIALFGRHRPDITLTDLRLARVLEQGRGRRMLISEETVKGHVRNILGKLSENDRTHAVTIELARGVIER